MIAKTAALALVIVGLLAGSANAAAGDLYISFFGADRTPDIDPVDGTLRPFICLSSDPSPPSATAAPAAGQECFVFRPDQSTVNRIKFARGNVLTRAGDTWTEAPGGFLFANQPGTKEALLLTDTARGISWSVPTSPQVRSTITIRGKTGPWYLVVNVGYQPTPPGHVAAPAVATPAFREQPARPANIPVVYTRKIDPRLRTDLYSIVNNWNRGAHTLTPTDCLGLIDGLAATVGAKRPHAQAATASDYVAALIKLNP